LKEVGSGRGPRLLAGGMLLCGRLLARAARTPLDTALARACSVEAPAALHRTTEVDPREHGMHHLGRHYSVNPSVPKLFGKELLPKENYNSPNYFGPRDWVDRCNKLQDTAIMVREPALQILHCLNNSDLARPANRYVLYGRPGCGKSLTLTHLTHWGHAKGWVVLPLLNLRQWLVKPYDWAPSAHTAGAIDHINNANVFLRNFKAANPGVLDTAVTHREYVWSAREKTPVGAPLAEVVDLGIERLNFAADAMNVVLRELRANASDGAIKLLVVVDGVNCLFSPYTLLNKDHTTRFLGRKGPRRRGQHPRVETQESKEWMSNLAKVDDCTVLKSIKRMLGRDYSGAAVVTSVDARAMVRRQLNWNRWWVERERAMTPDTDPTLPFALLGEEGWRTMDPFLPIEVLPYSEAELDSAIDYYIERGWIGAHSAAPAARQEIHFLTGRVPGDFFRFSSVF